MGITFQLPGISLDFCSSKVQLGVLIYAAQDSVCAILFLRLTNWNQLNVFNWMLFLFFFCRRMMLPSLSSPTRALALTSWLTKAKMTSSCPRASYCLITSSLPAPSGKSQSSSDCSRQVASAVLGWWILVCDFWFYAAGNEESVCKGAGMLPLRVYPWPREEEGEKWHFPVALAIKVCITRPIQPRFTTRCRRASSLDRLSPSWGLRLPVLGWKHSINHL